MNATDILLTLYSILAGLGISLLVQGIGNMIAARNHVQLYWAHTAWLAIIFLSHIVTWFALMRFAHGAHWTIFNSVLILFVPILLYLASHLVVPVIGSQERVDMRKHYYGNYRWFQSPLIAVVIIGIVSPLAIEHRLDWSPGGLLRLFAILAVVAGLVSRRPAVHAAQAVALLVIIALGAAYISQHFM